MQKVLAHQVPGSEIKHQPAEIKNHCFQYRKQQYFKAEEFKMLQYRCYFPFMPVVVSVRHGDLVVYLPQTALSNEGILNEHPLSLEVPCLKPLAHYSNKVFSTAEELKQTQQFFEAR